MLYPFLENIRTDFDYLLFIYLFVFVGLSTLWNVYFVKRIIYFVRLYRQAVKTANTDMFGNSSELALHYKVEIIKYLFLMIINIIEMSTILIDEFGLELAHSKSNNPTTNNCTMGSALYNSDFNVIISKPIAGAFITVGQVGLLLSITLVTGLVKYLNTTYHDINAQPLKAIMINISVSCVIGVLLFITGSVRQLYIFERLIYPIILLVYFCIWTKQVRSLYKTLKWKAVELKVRGMSSQIVRRAVKTSYHFGIITTFIVIGVGCMVLTEFLDHYFFLFATVVYCPNFINQVYGALEYEPLLTTETQINALDICCQIITGIVVVLSLVAFLVIGSQYLLATVVFFGGLLIKKLKYRFGRVRTRYTPSLTDPLLITKD